MNNLFNKNLLRMKIFNIKKDNGRYFFDLRVNDNKPEKYYKAFSYKGELIVNTLKSYLLENKIFKDDIEHMTFVHDLNGIKNIPNGLDVWVECLLRQDKDNNIDILINKISRRLKK